MNTIYAETTPGKIRVLSEAAANQIAAGEVVERPASILKELIENSIDAGARHVWAAIRNGGKSHIDVIDDGGGMGRDDALLCLERHATSKIRDHKDLASIRTMGFRGEALPSIASVSRMILATSPARAQAGTEIVIEGGKLLDVRDCAPVMGTRMTVNGIFFNVPARRKFLKGENAEAGHCHEAVCRQAMGAPAVGFTHTRDGKRIFHLPPGEDGPKGLAARIVGLFGEKTMASLSPVDYSAEGMRVAGFISRPGGGRSARDMQYVYVNRRSMRDKIIFHAVNEAYRSILPKGVHPVLFLYIDVPAERVDVNVSPTKAEARFTDNQMVIDLVRDGLLTALERRSAAAREPMPSGIGFGPSQNPAPGRPMILREPMAPFPMETAPATREPVSAAFVSSPAMPAAPQEGGALSLGLDIPGHARVVGQVFKTFILLEADDRLFLVDQHTAHERINYEILSRRYRAGGVEAQELLFPIPVELSAPRMELLRRLLGDLGKLGFALEEFGPREYHIRAVPRILAGADHRAIIEDTLEKASGVDTSSGFESIVEPAINIMACRGAVKAGGRLDIREMESLIQRLGECRLPYTCPHGRPVALSVSREELYRGFLRK
jgi:DNA mismatch repair protein MutL